MAPLSGGRVRAGAEERRFCHSKARDDFSIFLQAIHYLWVSMRGAFLHRGPVSYLCSIRGPLGLHPGWIRFRFRPAEAGSHRLVQTKQQLQATAQQVQQRQ